MYFFFREIMKKGEGVKTLFVFTDYPHRLPLFKGGGGGSR